MEQAGETKPAADAQREKPDQEKFERDFNALVERTEARSGHKLDDYSKFLLHRELWESRYGK